MPNKIIYYLKEKNPRKKVDWRKVSKKEFDKIEHAFDPYQMVYLRKTEEINIDAPGEAEIK